MQTRMTAGSLAVVVGVGLAVSCSSVSNGGDGAASSTASGDRGGDAAACTPLVIADPTVSLDGYALFLPDEKRNDPNAGEPSYVFLAAGREAVVVRGPDVTNAPGLFALEEGSISLVDQSQTLAGGYAVKANARLAYRVTIGDFEAEVALARVELCQANNVIESRFVFRGNPEASGVAHDITIVAVVDAMLSAPSSPVTVEVR